MTFASYKAERIGFGLLLVIALLMAFEPLARLHDPNGARVSDAFDLPTGIRQLQSELRIVAPIKSSAYSDAGSNPATATPATPGPLPMPFSIRTAAIVPWCVFAALAFGLLALVDLLFLRKWFELLSLIAGFSAAIALLYVLILGSDLLAWTDTLMSINELSSPGDSALGARILMANSFLVSPGIGLYVLTACLLLVPFLSITRTIPRVRGVIRSARRIRTSQPIHVRPINSQYAAETCMSLDLSESGLYLESPSNHYYVGMEVFLTRNVPAGGPANDDEHGYVVRVEKAKNDGCRFAIHVIPNA
ncbi:MAG TPA: PilZ domain-containing protein [Candidatus Acidoferrum sp.]|jgi:hypothetical protein|nr:PilZ domain-containing protein [Candidatus Acidoferrum sp.]